MATERLLLLSQLSVGELEHLREAIDKMLERQEESVHPSDWIGAYRFSQSVREELSKRQQQYPDDGTM